MGIEGHPWRALVVCLLPSRCMRLAGSEVGPSSLQVRQSLHPALPSGLKRRCNPAFVEPVNSILPMCRFEQQHHHQ